jgi:hypothetical protein
MKPGESGLRVVEARILRLRGEINGYLDEAWKITDKD